MFATRDFFEKKIVILRRFVPKDSLPSPVNLLPGKNVISTEADSPRGVCTVEKPAVVLALISLALFILAIPITASAQAQPGSNHSANEDPSSASRAGGVSTYPAAPAIPDTAPTPQEQARHSAALYTLLQQDVMKLKEVSAQLQQAVDQSPRDQPSFEVVRLSKQAEQLTRRINSEIRQH